MIRRIVVVGVIIAALLVRAGAQSQTPARDAPAARSTAATAAGVIAGTVVTDERTPQPARNARVTLNVSDRSMPGRTATTDDRGRFAFTSVPAGRYLIAVTKPGYLTTNYGARKPDRAGTPLALADGQRVDDITLRLAHGGAISGSVRDPSGQPMPGVSVAALRYGYSVSGDLTLSRAGGSDAVTDDRGTYRVWALPPGDYVVMATASALAPRPLGDPDDVRRLTSDDVQRVLASPAAFARGAGPARGDDGRVFPALGASVAFTPVFHPSAIDITSAARVTLGLSEDRAGVDVAMQLVPAARLTGTVKLPADVRWPEVEVTLAPVVDGPDGSPNEKRPMRLDQTGAFAIGGIAPGRYTLTAKSGIPAGRGAPARVAGSSAGPAWWAMLDLAFDGRDQNVAIELQPPMAITGRVVFDGTSPAPPLDALRMFLQMPGAGGNLSAGPAGGQMDAQGRFTFTGVTPGTYWPAVARTTRLPEMDQWVQVSSRVNGRDALDAPIVIAPNENAEWVITFGDKPAALAGTLQDASGRAASDYFIVVFSTDRAYWTPRSRRIASVRPDTEGRFSVKGLPAGDYYVAALTDLEPGEWFAPSFLDAAIAGAVKVALADGRTTTQDFRLSGR